MGHCSPQHEQDYTDFHRIRSSKCFVQETTVEDLFANGRQQKQWNKEKISLETRSFFEHRNIMPWSAVSPSVGMSKPDCESHTHPNPGIGCWLLGEPKPVDKCKK